jgi:hypothetical protein
VAALLGDDTDAVYDERKIDDDDADDDDGFRGLAFRSLL